MIVTFNGQYLEAMYRTGQTDAEHDYPPEVTDRYAGIVDVLVAAPTIYDLRRLCSLNYKRFTGNELGSSSVRINDDYRLSFTVIQTADSTVVTINSIIKK
jgi:proteic killer suppression protein